MPSMRPVYVHHIFIKEAVSNIGTYAFIRATVINHTSEAFTYDSLLAYLSSKKDLGGTDDGILATGILTQGATGSSPTMKPIIALKRFNSTTIGAVTMDTGYGQAYESTAQLATENIETFQDQVYMPMDEAWVTATEEAEQ